MVRVPGSSGDSQGFHRESTEEDVKIKMEPGNESSTEEGSPPTALKAPGSTDRESAGRSSDDVKEEGSAMDLEEKPQTPPQVPSGTPADRDANRDPPDEGPTVKTEGPSSKTTPPVPHATSKKKKSKPSRKKLKAPESEAEDQEDCNTWMDEQLESAFFYKDLYKFLHEDPVMKIVRPKPIGELQGPVKAPKEVTSQLEAVKLLMRMLKEAEIVLGSFDANELFDLELPIIRESTLSLFAKLTPLVGSVVPVQRERPAPTRSQTGSSQYASDTSEAGSDSSIELQRMTLGPAGAAMLQSRKERSETKPRVIATSDPAQAPPERMQSFFNAAMERFLKEQQAVSTTPVVDQTKPPGAQDVDMESVESNRRDHSHPSEYDPDDLGVDATPRAAVASAGTTGGGTLSATRIRVSAISELKEFSGKDNDEDRARSWFGKLKSAFVRDQAPDGEKCLVFGDLLTGPARNWYRQLSRTTRGNWKSLSKNFQTQYCGRGVSVARQYYHARKRSDESPLEYLHRLNVAGLRAQLSIKDESIEVRREHVDHFIETLDDRDLASQLALLRIPDADTLEETLRSRQLNSSDSELETSGSEGEGDLRKVYFAATPDQPTRSHSDQEQRRPSRDSNDRRLDRPAGSLEGEAPRKPCSHCGSSKHTDLGCWKRLTCEKCGKKGHPTDRCLFVCKACGEIHGAGECPMEEFYNLIRQWYNPTKHGGMLPQAAEKMLN
uniref:Retrotransposon gag domain-containing protein n=1 Tax=Phytophthora ramorum TaxID=164328 RepID=H3H647_PHYRM